MSRKNRTPWQKIRDAGAYGVGLRLRADEVAQLCGDYAITTAAENDDEYDAILRDELREARRGKERG